MRKKLPSIRKALDEKDVSYCLEQNYNLFSKEWVKILSTWMFNSYSVFKDHNKYLILIFLVKKTFDFYSSSYVKLTWEQFFELKRIEIGKFNIINVARELNISRETARRKIKELEKDKILVKTKQGIVVLTTFYNKEFIRDHEEFRKSISLFIVKCSDILSENKIIKEKISSPLVETFVVDNFTFAWNAFFEMLIPLLIGWKNIFKDLESWHILTTVLISQNYEVIKIMKLKNIKVSNRHDYLNIHSMEKIDTGINAMSISTLTGIPRATVIRKLNKLINSKNLSIDHRKLYTVKIKNIKNNYLNTQTIENTKRISAFLTKILNLIVTSK